MRVDLGCPNALTKLARKRQSTRLKSDDQAADPVRAAARASREQADYGHPGRLNNWETGRIDRRLQANVEELGTIAEALFAVVERSAE